MTLQKRLDSDELAMLEIIEDPVWLGEFLRSTSDFALNEDERNRRKPFNYRWYQKDLLTDQSPYISIRGGRSIGKCHGRTARIYTYPEGYMLIRDLISKYGENPFMVPALAPNGSWEIRRAYIRKNVYDTPNHITTESGFRIDVTDNHPVLTPRGWTPAGELAVGDVVAVPIRLPSESRQSLFHWAELRWFGYMLLNPRIRVQNPFTKIRYQRQVDELREIAKYFDAVFEDNRNGTYSLIRKIGNVKHHGTRLIEMLDPDCFRHEMRLFKLPAEIKCERNENIKVFLESLFSYHGQFSNDKVRLEWSKSALILDIQELLLRLGIETVCHRIEGTWDAYLETRDYNAFYQFFTQLSIPGVTVRDLKEPPVSEIVEGTHRYEPITIVDKRPPQATYAIQVNDHENYISGGVIVHNSVVLEDKLIYNAINADKEFPETRESLLATANNSQMTPLLDHIIGRFSSSPFLRSFLNGQVNRSKGTLDFTLPGGALYRMWARIAGAKGESNVVGLHLPRIVVDEVQLFPMNSWIQLQPVLNAYEAKTQVITAGVPSGLRDGNVLYMLDQRNGRYKRYRIPATENPNWTQEDHINAIKEYMGEDADDFQRLVLGQHGDAAFTVIPRDRIRTEPYEFYSYRYNQSDKLKNRVYQEVLNLPKLPMKIDMAVLSIDTGYTDPTIVQLIGYAKGTWRTLVRWRLTRISFPEQAEIIDWIATAYDARLIGLDLGAGGGGIGMMQDLCSARFSKTKNYENRIFGANFGVTVDRQDGMAPFMGKTSAKSAAGEELARMVSEGDLVFSELDMEAISQLERVAYTKRTDGSNQYFVLSERGTGKAQDDHIFAAYLVFIMTMGNLTTVTKQRKRLFNPRWV